MPPQHRDRPLWTARAALKFATLSHLGKIRGVVDAGARKHRDNQLIALSAQIPERDNTRQSVRTQAKPEFAEPPGIESAPRRSAAWPAKQRVVLLLALPPPSSAAAAPAVRSFVRSFVRSLGRGGGGEGARNLSVKPGLPPGWCLPVCPAYWMPAHRPHNRPSTRSRDRQAGRQDEYDATSG